mmetsp:Transcript_16694/g.23540  ORF Transcript_16694/g.23540 Transcript_16694/m.23540 type:complete len:495 (+) Transcript_16694:257-1741(+)
MEPIESSSLHEHYKQSFRDSIQKPHNLGDRMTLVTTNLQDDRSLSSSMPSSSSSSSSMSSSPTSLPRDFSELHVQDHRQQPALVSSSSAGSGFGGGGLEALALACVATAPTPSTSSSSKRPTTKPKKKTMKPTSTSNKTSSSTAATTLVTDRSLALVGKKDQIVLPVVENGETVVSTDEGATTNGNHISQSDVLCGRGGLTNHHAGNMFFRRLVRLKQEAYLLASKREKAGVARDIVDSIRALDPPGRFLKKDAKHPNTWVEIGDRKAREKTSQALREGAPELREVVKNGTTTTTPANSTSNNTNKKSTTTSSPSLVRSSAPSPTLPPSTTSSHLINESSSRTIQLSTSPPTAFNRVRIVSDDSVVEWGYRNGVERVQQQAQDVSPPSRTQSHSQSTFMLPVCEADVDISQQQQHQNHHHHRLPPRPYYYEHSDLPHHALYSSSAAVVSTATAGAKRKSPTNCSVQERHTWESSSCTKKRGPRLKLFKSRLMDY